jgi:glycosyltransferase involved in cell wall biosynthesis
MKLIIQIPCLNEEASLPVTLRELPTQLDGVDELELLVIDDGSTDRTSQVASELGVNHVIRFPRNRGLARAFMAGLDACLRLGADIIVNTDADNQYCADDIQKLIQPILDGRAEMVIGDRQVETVADFSPLKKRLQKLGSWFVRQISGTDVPDATSGFRALSREAALRINIMSTFSYTLESIIQAGKKGIIVTHVPVRTNRKMRDSRLFTSIKQYIARSLVTTVRMYTMFRPLRVFTLIGVALLAGGTGVGLRFIYYLLAGSGTGHVQSVILCGALIIMGLVTLLIGILADVISFNRQLIEDTLYRTRRIELALEELKRTEGSFTGIDRMHRMEEQAASQRC